MALVPLDPGAKWRENSAIVEQIGRWTRDRGRSLRLFPASLIWCAKKPGRELRAAVELWLAWRRVASEVVEGVLGADYDKTDRAEIQAEVKAVESAAKDEVWSGYRFVVLFEPTAPNKLKVVDLGAGHASASQTLCGRVIAALKGEALLNESVGAGYLDRHWPPSFKADVYLITKTAPSGRGPARHLLSRASRRLSRPPKNRMRGCSRGAGSRARRLDSNP